MILLECLLVLSALYLGTRIGSIGIGLASGFGLLFLILLGLKPGSIPFDVIQMIMAVTVAIAAMQAAGGMHYLVERIESLLKHQPQRIMFLAPLITYSMTLLTGTGYMTLALLPVIIETAKGQGITPSRPLSLAVVASQIAVTASPLSAAVLVVASLIKPFGIHYLQLLMIVIPTTLAAVILTSALFSRLGGPAAPRNQPTISPAYPGDGHPAPLNNRCQPAPHYYGKRSVRLFFLGIIMVIGYAILISDPVGWIQDPALTRPQAIIIAMLSVATMITLCCRVEGKTILTSDTFTAGMSACICILGVAWLGDTLISNHIDVIQKVAGAWLINYPWLLAVILFFAATLLYSQAATAKALLPAALAIGVSPSTVVASFAAVSALFVLPTYPTLLAAVAMDDTGSTRIGRYLLNHPFFLPGIVVIILSVLLSFLLIQVVL
jgi:anaerobic C4-dicarboxylate transporter DcuA